jgi:hypothetical protein
MRARLLGDDERPACYSRYAVPGTTKAARVGGPAGFVPMLTHTG